MRSVLLCLLAAGLSGCFAEVLTTTAMRGQLAAQQGTAANQALNHVKGTTGRTKLEGAIRFYQAEQGVFPPSLKTLVPKYIEEIPLQASGKPYGYDPASGALLEQALSAAGPTQADYQRMQAINAAINQFGNATGYYPPTLDDLYPAYLAELPRTASGDAFVYNNKNGYVAHPRAGGRVPQPANRRRGGGMGGGGPMGEAMTGIAIQNELGSMNQSGATGAGSRMRQSTQGLGVQQTDRTSQAMDDLGL
jgi:hypothetical protein